MHPALQHLGHRPWPLPNRSWIWRQSWLDLAFIHYRVRPAELEARLPPGLRLERFDGSAWVGLVPFRMSGVMRRPLPDVPGFGTFPELNVRTYVDFEGRPGVWFFSLDAASLPIVLGGRLWYRLPYFAAVMHQRWDGGWCHFSSRRRRTNLRFRATYRPAGSVFTAAKGSFEHWATERYCLYAPARKPGLGIVRVEVHHAPWPLQPAQVEIEESTLLEAAGIHPGDDPPLSHFSSGVEVVSFPGETLRLPSS